MPTRWPPCKHWPRPLSSLPRRWYVRGSSNGSAASRAEAVTSRSSCAQPNAISRTCSSTSRATLHKGLGEALGGAGCHRPWLQGVLTGATRVDLLLSGAAERLRRAADGGGGKGSGSAQVWFHGSAEDLLLQGFPRRCLRDCLGRKVM